MQPGKLGLLVGVHGPYKRGQEHREAMATLLCRHPLTVILLTGPEEHAQALRDESSPKPKTFHGKHPAGKIACLLAVSTLVSLHTFNLQISNRQTPFFLYNC